MALGKVKKEAAEAAQEALNEANNYYINHANRSISNSSTNKTFVRNPIKENSFYNISDAPCDDLVQTDLAEVISTVHFWVEELCVFNISNLSSWRKTRWEQPSLSSLMLRQKCIKRPRLVPSGSFNLEQLNGTSCDAMWRDEAYVTAKQAPAEAAMALEQAVAQE